MTESRDRGPARSPVHVAPAQPADPTSDRSVTGATSCGHQSAGDATGAGPTTAGTGAATPTAHSGGGGGNDG